MSKIMGTTVTTFLIDGDPKGSQYVFVSNKICKMYVIPRSNLAILNERRELQTPAFYILLGEDENSKPKAYIGETENFRERVKDHDSKKAFWMKALLFISKDADMTKADVQYLEYCAIAEAKASNTFVLNENKQTPKAPNLPEHRKNDMDGFFEDVKFLTAFVGCRIFDVAKPNDEHLFYTKGRGCKASGFYHTNGFTVLKGSIIAKTTVPSVVWKENREKQLKDCTVPNGENLELVSDMTFSSPSSAAVFCIGSSNNGWLVWKDKDDQTLDDVYRKQLETSLESN